MPFRRGDNYRAWASATTGAAFVPSPLNQNAPHGFGGRRHEMGLVLKLGVAGAHHAEPGLVDERGRLQGLAGGFVGHLAAASRRSSS